MTEYIAPPRSRANLREIARQFRSFLHLENELYFPIVQVLDVMAMLFHDFSYEIIADTEWVGTSHACTDMRTGCIRIRESVYNSACEGGGRDRMMIAHEIAHWLLHYSHGFTLQRNFELLPVKSYMDPEWQAKCLAGELMVDAVLLAGKQPHEIARLCGVSYAAAQCQFDKTLRFRRWAPGKIPDAFGQCEFSFDNVRS